MVSKEIFDGLSLHPEMKVYLNQNVLIDDQHLDCIWYHGKRLATVQFRDMFLDVVASDSIELEGIYHGKEFNEKTLFDIVPDDNAIEKLRDISVSTSDNRLVIRHENWLDYTTYDSEIESMLFGSDLLSVIEEISREIEDLYREHQKRTNHFVNWSKQADRKAVLAEVFNFYEYDFPTMSGVFDKFVTEKVFDLINNGLSAPVYGNGYRCAEPLIQRIREAFCELDLDGENIRTFAMQIIANIIRNYSFLPVEIEKKIEEEKRAAIKVVEKPKSFAVTYAIHGFITVNVEAEDKHSACEAAAKIPLNFAHLQVDSCNQYECKEV